VVSTYDPEFCVSFKNSDEKKSFLDLFWQDGGIAKSEVATWNKHFILMVTLI
jgi:hypothetical protein